MAILAVVYAAGDVNPPGRAAMLQYQLVVVNIIFHPLEQQTGYLFRGGIAEGPRAAGDGDVGSLALHVLGGFGTANKPVELGAAVARGDLYGQAEVLTQGFETALAEVLQGRDVALQWDVGNLMALGRLRAQHLRERKVLAEEHRGIENLFHVGVG